MVFFAVVTYAQKDVTTFLGIPVDGSKSEMKQKLIAKGYVPKKNGDDEYLEGEFNGTDVLICIATNNNKVYRIMLCDVHTQNEVDIKIRFNKLVRQFKDNKRYIAVGIDDYTLPESENISYEMSVHSKRYEASFYQLPDMEKMAQGQGSESLGKKVVWFMISKFRYDEYYITMFYDNEYNHANGEDL